MLSDMELERYSRHLLVKDLGIEAQHAWHDAEVLIVGCGGLGHPLSFYIAAAGVGKITLVDPDFIELSNLQRQFGFIAVEVGQSKAQVLARRLRALNPLIEIHALQSRFEELETKDVEKANLWFDCSDNFACRYAINNYSLRLKTALISGAALEMDGLCTLLNQTPNSPCYACLFPINTTLPNQRNCSESGVFAPLLGLVGSMQAQLGLSYIANKQIDSVQSILYRWNLARNIQSMSILKKNPHCNICSQS